MLGAVLAVLLVLLAAAAAWFFVLAPDVKKGGAGKAPLSPAMQKAMQSDPQLKAMMEDIQKNGPSAATKYLQDEELMVKVSRISGASSGPLKVPTGASTAGTSEPQTEQAGRKDLRRRAQKERRQKNSSMTKEEQIRQFERQREKEDQEAWEAMQREMAKL
mmetsp:Transcript_10485/g.23576  ORF Transcript_10485/g.23576 Transcript_10485/m.23576 type:complete len:161 (-) Transcript_10485:185-667(-)